MNTVEEIQARIALVETRLTDLAKEAATFKREVILGGNEGLKTLRYYRSKELSYDTTLERLRLEHAEQKKSLAKLNLQLQGINQEDPSKSIGYLDFHQLLLETNSQTTQSCEVLKEIGDLKFAELSSRSKVAKLQGLLDKARHSNNATEKALVLREKHLKRLDSQIKCGEQSLKASSSVPPNDAERDEHENLNNVDVMELITQSGELQKVRNDHKIWKRKVHLAEMKYKRNSL